MEDCGNANHLLAIGQLVEDPKGTDAQRVEAAQLAAQRVAGSRFALQQSQHVLDRVDQRPVESKKSTTGATGKYDSRHRSTGGGAAFRQLAAQLGEGDRLIASYLGEAGL